MTTDPNLLGVAERIAEGIDLGAGHDCGCNDMDVGCPCPPCLSMAYDILDVLTEAGFEVRLASEVATLRAAIPLLRQEHPYHVQRVREPCEVCAFLASVSRDD